MKKTLCFFLVLNLLFVLQPSSQTVGWYSQTSGTNNNLNAVYFANSATGTIVGNLGTVLRTTNSGTNWFAQSTGANFHLYSVWFINTTTGILVGDLGRVFRTTNGGSSWTSISSPSVYQLRSIYFINSTTGFVAGWYGYILKTTDAGVSWSQLTSGTTANLNSIAFTGANTGNVSGINAQLLKTTNGGNTWTTSGSGSNWSIESIYYYNASTGIIIGESGSIRVTTNSGTSWANQNSGTTNWLYSMANPFMNFTITVGQLGVVRKTSNGGVNWWAQTSNVSAQLNGVQFSDTNSGTAVGDGGVIIRTTTGGWLLPQTPTLSSPNNGATCVSLTPNLDWTDIAMPISWFRVQVATDTSFASPVVNASFIPVSNYTVPSGALQFNTFYYWRVRATNQVGDGAWTTNRSFRTTWATPSVPNLIVPPNNDSTQPLTPFLCWDSITTASSYRVRIATDVGFTNMVWDTSGIVPRSVTVRNGLLSYSTRYYWRITPSNPCLTGGNSVTYNFKTTGLTGISQLGNEIPMEFKLYNNYPNPFNPSTEIKFDLPKPENVTIKIYTITGEEAAAVLNEFKSAGKYTFTFNAGNLASGIYIYRIQTSSFKDSKIMALIK